MSKTQELTIYLPIAQQLSLDDLHGRLREMGLTTNILSDVGPEAPSGRVFITLQEGESMSDTFVDAKIVVLDFNADAGLVNLATRPLIEQLRNAAGEAAIDRLVTRLNGATLSYYGEFNSSRPALKLMAIAIAVACLSFAPTGVIHDGRQDEFYVRETVDTLVAREFPDDPQGQAILDVLARR